MSQVGKQGAATTFEPIAMVKNDVTEKGKRGWTKVTSQLIFRPDLEDALEGLKEFSHIIVVFWFHLSLSGESAPHKTHPQMRPDLPLVGVFATRSPVRPNAVGVSVVKLQEQTKNVLTVTGLDALNGTPVLDIKPYLPRDSVAGIKVPDWVHKLHQHD